MFIFITLFLLSNFTVNLKQWKIPGFLQRGHESFRITKTKFLAVATGTRLAMKIEFMRKNQH